MDSVESARARDKVNACSARSSNQRTMFPLGGILTTDARWLGRLIMQEVVQFLCGNGEIGRCNEWERLVRRV
jgi:hypothetical protein